MTKNQPTAVYSLPNLLDSQLRIKVEVDSPIGPLVRSVRAGLSWLMWGSLPGDDNPEELADLRNFFLMALSYSDERPSDALIAEHEHRSAAELAELVVDQGAAFHLS